MTYFEVNGCSKFFTNNKEVKILEDINLSIDKGEFVCLIGASGCGKTTLLRMMAGFENITSGSIQCNGEKITKPQMEYVYIFQDFNQNLPWKTVRKNIEYPFTINKRGDKKEIGKKVDELLNLIELNESADCYPHTLSGGMKQRVAIARALAMQPKVLFMDEPFSALDAKMREKLQNELIKIWKEYKLTVVFVTHSIAEAIYLATKIVVLNGNPQNGNPGKIVRIINCKENHPKTPADVGYSELWKWGIDFAPVSFSLIFQCSRCIRVGCFPA
jgi:NitT/TauT family transport system ATP-binding protein